MAVTLCETDSTFKAFPHLNKTPPEYASRSRLKLADFAKVYFPDDSLEHRLIRALGETKDIGPKEVLESFEFYARVRRRIRAPAMADLCCGHGLVGLLFAVLQRDVERVSLIDSQQSKGSRAILEAVQYVAPWVVSKVMWIESEVEDMASHLAPGVSLTAVHACGQLTDHCIEIAKGLGSRIAVMPCCYGPRTA